MQSDNFQADLYPDTASDVPALSAEQWWNEKKDANPVMVLFTENHLIFFLTRKEILQMCFGFQISLKGGYQAKSAQTLQVAKKSNILDKMPSKGGAAGGAAVNDADDVDGVPPEAETNGNGATNGTKNSLSPDYKLVPNPEVCMLIVHSMSDNFLKSLR